MFFKLSTTVTWCFCEKAKTTTIYYLEVYLEYYEDIHLNIFIREGLENYIANFLFIYLLKFIYKNYNFYNYLEQ